MQGWFLGRNEVIHFPSLPIRALPAVCCSVTTKLGEFLEDFYLAQFSLSSGDLLSQPVHLPKVDSCSITASFLGGRVGVEEGWGRTVEQG